MTLTVGSLFSGIGGIDLGLESVGMRVRWQVEIDPYCRSVLRRHWPEVTLYGDVSAVDWSDVERVDLVCGGFPCQPASLAGRQRGKDDDRWLWPEFERCVRALRPRFVLVENVAGLLTVNHGRAFGDVLGDLAALGYDASWGVFGARDVGAPHRRDRLWLVASDSKRARLEGSQGIGGDSYAQRATAQRGNIGSHWSRGPTVSPICKLDDGIPRNLARSQWISAIRALGNAVVPQCAAHVGDHILRMTTEEVEQ